MLLCEGTAVVLDMVRPKAQLMLTACESKWSPEGQHGGGGTASIVTSVQLTDHHPGCEAHAVRAHTFTCMCIHTHPAHAHSCMHTSVSEGVG